MDWLSRELISQHAELTEERNLLDKLLINLDAGVTYLDTDLVYVIVNPYFADMFGLKPKDFLGKKLFSVYPETAEQLRPIFEKTLATRKQQALRRYQLKLNGSTKYWNTTVTPISDESGALMGLLTLCFDVTDSVLLERQK